MGDIIPMTVPGEVPGRVTRTLGMEDSYTGEASVAWPDSFPIRTRVRLTIKGKFGRQVGNITNSYYSSLSGNWFDLDADGHVVASQCWGFVYTDFKFTGYPYAENIVACGTSPNFQGSPALDSFSIDGWIRGRNGTIRRFAQYDAHPNIPRSACLHGVCILVSQGSQQITIEPTSQFLTVSATPVAGNEGDTVTFTASDNRGLAITVLSWTWVPDSIVGYANTAGQVSGVCGATTVCKMPVWMHGRMYVRALVGFGSTIEQASVAVKPTPQLCLTGDSLIDQPVVRQMLKDIERKSLSTVPPKEFAGALFRDTLTGALIPFVDTTAATANYNTCYKSAIDESLFPPNAKMVLLVHSHPYFPRDTICTGALYGTNYWGRVPSGSDWLKSKREGVPGVIIDRSQLISYRVPTVIDTIIKKRRFDPVKRDTFITPPKSHLNSLVNTVSRGGLCVLP